MPLTLWQAIESTLKYQWDIQLSYEDIIRQAGTLQETAGPFDPIFNANYEHRYIENAQIILRKTDKVGHRNFLGVSATKLTRFGTQTAMGLEILQEHNPASFIARTNQAVTFFTIDQPLLRDFMHNQQWANELSACYDLRAVKAQFIFTMSSLVRDVVQRYWETLAAKELLKIRQESLERLEDLTESVRQLIEGGQLAETEINQQLAQLYNEKTRTETAVQTLFDAYNNLRLTMGQPRIPYCLEAPQLDLEDFPKIKAAEKPCCIENLLALASQYRGDYIASLWGIQSRSVQVKSAKNALLPQLDLNLGIAMRNHELGNNAEPFFKPLASRLPQKEWAIGASLSVPLCNDVAKGVYRRRLAERRQTCVTSDEIYETMRTEIANVVRNHFALVKEIEYAEETVKWYRKAWNDERRRLKEGYSTLFVVLDFEDRLNAALIERLVKFLDYAVNLANLYFFTGQLVVEDACANRVFIADVSSADTLLEPGHG